jgi:tetrahydromethanopterin S-methyltransferase subunit H
MRKHSAILPHAEKPPIPRIKRREVSGTVWVAFKPEDAEMEGRLDHANKSGDQLQCLGLLNCAGIFFHAGVRHCYGEAGHRKKED